MWEVGPSGKEVDRRIDFHFRFSWRPESRPVLLFHEMTQVEKDVQLQPLVEQSEKRKLLGVVAKNQAQQILCFLIGALEPSKPPVDCPVT